MTTTKHTPSAGTLAAIEEKALAEMSPADRLAYQQRERQIAAQEEANALTRVKMRLEADDPVAKGVAREKVAHEANVSHAEACGPNLAILLAVPLDFSSEFPGAADVIVEATAYKVPAGEGAGMWDTKLERPVLRGPSPVGKLRIRFPKIVDDSAAKSLIRAHVHEQARAVLDDLARQGEKMQAAELLEKLEKSVGTTLGFPTVKTLALKLITVRIFRLLPGKLVEDLVAAGVVRIVGEAKAAEIVRAAE